MEREARKPLVKKSSAEKKPYKSIVIVNVPDSLLSRSILENHFAKFGTIVKTHVYTKNKSALINFTKSSEAKAAKERGAVVDANLPPLKMFYSDKGPDGRLSRPAGSTSTRPLSSSSASKPAASSLPTVSVNQIVPVKPITVIVTEPIPPTGDHSLHLFFPDTPEAQELFSRRAVTAEERYRLLEARDKLIRSKKPKVKMRVEFAEKLTGTCKDMCPEKERYMREIQRQLTSFEMAAGRDGEVDHRLAIKAYARSSADQEEPLPHELRPTETLEMSMLYILHNIIPREETLEDLSNWYNFVWDRMRGIRKDITQQQLFDKRAVSLMEKCARFHIHCSSRLSELDRHAFDPKLNDENLMKCLQSLEHMYTDLNLMGVKCPNEPEFRAYQILMNLNEGDILWEIQQKPPWVLASPEVQLAIKVHMAIFEKNYSKFFKLVHGAPYVTACILHRYFFQVRSTALRTIFRAYSMHNKSENYTSMSAVMRMLGYSEDRKELFQYFCESHGIVCDYEKDRIVLNRKTFDMPEFPSISRELYLIESKLNQPLNVIINGGPLDPNPYLTHHPHTTFNEQGYLISGELVGVPDFKHPSTVTRGQEQGLQTEKAVQRPAEPPQIDSFSWTAPTIPSSQSSLLVPPSVNVPFKPFSSSMAARTDSSSVFESPYQFPEGSKGLFRLPSKPPDAGVFSKPFASFPVTIRPFAPIASKPFAPIVSKPFAPIASKPFAPIASKPFAPLPDPRVVRRQEQISKVADKVLNKLTGAVVSSVCKDSRRSAEQERHARLQREEAITRTANSIYSRLQQSVIQNEVKMFWVRRRQIQIMVNRKSQQMLEALMSKEVGRCTRTICSKIYQSAVIARDKKLSRLKELMERLKLRFWLSKWKSHVKQKKIKREREMACKLRELENFPSYQNTWLTSPEQVLASWCGDLPRRRSFSLLPPSTKSKRSSYQGCEEDRAAESRLSKRTGENLKDEDIKKLYELYNFPASSNVNNVSPASVFLSWCRPHTGDSVLSTGDCEQMETKKRRLDSD